MDKQEKSLLHKTATITSGLAYLAKDATEAFFNTLEKNKLLSKDEGKQFAEKVKTQAKQRQEVVRNSFFAPLRSLVKELGLITREDLEEIMQNGKVSPKRMKNA